MSKPHNNVYISTHPLVQDKLADLRDKHTPHYRFKQLLEELSQFLFYEASQSLETRPQTIETPLESMECRRLGREVLLVPILRAGLGMVNGITQMWENSRVGMVGMYRDPGTLQPVDYYLRLPASLADLAVFLVDPMLATGGSAVAALDRLKERKAARICMITLICAPEGVEVVHRHHPDVPIYTAALDRQLNPKGYILPGLGDAGDRYFGV